MPAAPRPPSIREVTFEGHAAVELAAAGARLVVVHDVGPRIAWFGPARGDNLLFWDTAGTHARGSWRLRGGHRLWLTRPLADETEETYTPDNEPCRVRRLRDGVEVTAPPDASRLVKRLTIRARDGAFRVEHALTNAGDMLWSGGIWGLTCTRPRRGTTYGIPLGAGGDWDVFAIVVPRRWGGHSSRVADPQLRFTEACLVLRPGGRESKRMVQAPRGLIGMTDPSQRVSFVKHAAYDAAAAYPLGTNIAYYLGEKNFMVEMETMGPIRQLLPGATMVHVETWSLRAPIDWLAGGWD